MKNTFSLIHETFLACDREFFIRSHMRAVFLHSDEHHTHSTQCHRYKQTVTRCKSTNRSQTTTVFPCYKSACAVIAFVNRVHVRYDCHLFIFGYTYVCEYVRSFFGSLASLSGYV